MGGTFADFDLRSGLLNRWLSAASFLLRLFRSLDLGRAPLHLAGPISLRVQFEGGGVAPRRRQHCRWMRLPFARQNKWPVTASSTGVTVVVSYSTQSVVDVVSDFAVAEANAGCAVCARTVDGTCISSHHGRGKCAGCSHRVAPFQNGGAA